MYYCVSPWVVIIYRFYCTSNNTMCPLGGLICRFHCISTNTMCHLGGLYIQVRLYINLYNVSLGRSLYASSTVHQLIQCVPWVIFIIHTTSTEHQLINPLRHSVVLIICTGSTIHTFLSCSACVTELSP